MAITVVHEAMAPQTVDWLAEFYDLMRLDPMAVYYWHDDMPPSAKLFREAMLRQTQTVIAHTSMVPQALCIVQTKGHHPITGESLEGQVSLYVRRMFRSHGARLFRECLQAINLTKLPELYALIHPAHRSCRAITRACGFTYQDTLPGYLRFKGVPQDMRRYVCRPHRKESLDACDA